MKTFYTTKTGAIKHRVTKAFLDNPENQNEQGDVVLVKTDKTGTYTVFFYYDHTCDKWNMMKSLV